MTQPILRPELPTSPSPARARITAAWLRDETEALHDLLAQASLPAVERDKVIDLAAALVSRVRVRAKDQSVVESFMRQYDLSSEEGVLLMCVAEALLRIPDKAWVRYGWGGDDDFVPYQTGDPLAQERR